MGSQFARLFLVACVVQTTGSEGLAIDVTAVTNPNSAATLAANLNGSGSAITINSANFLINVSATQTTQSELRSIGTFTNGNVAGAVPQINQLNGAPATFAGGIGIDAGICLCTGVVTDADTDGGNAVAGSGVGVQGPNNGFALTEFFDQSTSILPGEISFMTNKPRDDDFTTKVKFSSVNEGDATAMQFQVSISQPGFLRISFVFASDEHPFHIGTGQFDTNDSMAIFVRHDDHSSPSFENFALLTSAAAVGGPMSLKELIACGAIIFRDNQIVPAPSGDLIANK